MGLGGAGSAAVQGQKEVSVDGGSDAAGAVSNARAVPSSGGGGDVLAGAGGNAAPDRGRGDSIELFGVADLRPRGAPAGVEPVRTGNTVPREAGEGEEDAAGSERDRGTDGEGAESRESGTTVAVGAVAGSVSGPAGEGGRGSSAGDERSAGGVAGVGVRVGEEEGLRGVGEARGGRAGQPRIRGEDGEGRAEAPGSDSRTRASGGGGTGVGGKLAREEKGDGLEE